VPKCAIFDLLFNTLIKSYLGGRFFGVFSKIEADICHFVFFTQLALKSGVSFENSFHLKKPMCLFDSSLHVLPQDVSVL
jgi:hypothetical protein